MGIPDHVTNCSLRSQYVAQKKKKNKNKNRTGHGTTDWFNIGKGIHQGCILSPCLFNLYSEYIMQIPGWMNHKPESRLLEEI